jgi:hypothetical protein
LRLRRDDVAWLRPRLRKLRFQMIADTAAPVPDRSPEYLAWIRTLGCVICARESGGATVVEAAHTNVLGARGLGQKTSDFSTVPLCSGHHREYPDSYHFLGEEEFSRKHGSELKEVVRRLQRICGENRLEMSALWKSSRLPIGETPTLAVH